MKGYLGIDVGSVSTNIVFIDEKKKLIEKIYIRTKGDPISSVKSALKQIQEKLAVELIIKGVGVSGSARSLIGAMVGADVIKNEITAHAVAAMTLEPEAKTIIEIGGQDSKIILIRDGVVIDFAMNNVCAAGTGSFLDQQASRLGIPIEEFGAKALESKTDVSIAGRCTVFAESDMIHKQQLGYSIEDIINGLCYALVRNYFNTVAKGKDIQDLVLFQGGVAANIGIRRAFNNYLGTKVKIPEHFSVMGAYGAAVVALETMKKEKAATRFKGFALSEQDYKTTSFECADCPNTCEVVEFFEEGRVIARFGDRCKKHSV